MIYRFTDPALESILHLISEEPNFQKEASTENGKSDLYIIWNKGPEQNIAVDEVSYTFPSNSVVPLMANNTFRFSNAENIIAWQFNKDFYCIIDHDKEVGCAGFLFYGSKDHLFITLDERSQNKLATLYQVFQDEYLERDNIQGEMLRMLLKRLIIMMTRLGKQQYLSTSIGSEDVDIIRQFNLLVENHFRQHHQVQDYANLMHKSPKTLSNLFAKYNSKSPLQVIKDRLLLEAKRLLQYTDKSSKEIAFDLGFDDPATFSRFFKNQAKLSPSAFKKTISDVVAG